jgi:uncharacterized protein (TIRG00374 family)
MRSTMRDTFATLALRLVTFGATGAFVVWGVRWREVVDSLRGARIVPLVVVVALNAGMMAIKAVRLRLLLGNPRSDRSPRPSFAVCFLALLTSSAINNVTPLRGGDIARLWILQRSAGIPKAAGVGVTVVEKLIEIFSLAALVISLSFLVPGQRWSWYAAPIVLVGVGVALVALWWYARPGARSVARESDRPNGPWARARRLGERFAPGVTPLHERGVLARVLALSGLAWACETLMVAVCALSVGLPIGLALGPVILFGINLAIAVPAAPAGAGPFEGAMVVVLTLAGIAKGPALAFALLYHAVQVIPVTLAGLGVISNRGIALGGPPDPSGLRDAART